MLGGRPQREDIYALGVEPQEIPDPGASGALDVSRSGYVLLVSAAAETRTLAVPTFIGQRLVLICKTDGGDNVVTVASAYNASGNTIITFNDVGDTIALEGGIGAAAAFKWNQMYTNGPSLS